MKSSLSEPFALILSLLAHVARVSHIHFVLRYTCPFCSAGGMNERTLVAHIQNGSIPSLLFIISV
jgi:hypothetical protein